MVRKAEEKQKKRFEILAWAIQHGWVINPSKGMEHYVETYFKFECCPCDKNRTECPCMQAIEEVKEKGHCLCRLFWRDLDAFRKTLKGAGDEEGTADKVPQISGSGDEDRDQS